jgi:hypothetical protein
MGRGRCNRAAPGMHVVVELSSQWRHHGTIRQHRKGAGLNVTGVAAMQLLVAAMYRGTLPALMTAVVQNSCWEWVAGAGAAQQRECTLSLS